jgi:CRISPR-associated protein Csb1
MSNDILTKYDDWLKDDGPAAIVLREYLIPAEGRDSPVFPPTYPPVEGSPDRRPQYNIDPMNNGKESICLIDSVGSQANRLEPIFKGGEYAKLVPQVTIRVGNKTVNLLDVGHRSADAIARFSDLAGDLKQAFEAWRDKGNALNLAKIAPTTLLFGAWDSRDTQAKVPRILASVIHGTNADPLTRSAQYIPPIDYVAEGVLDAADGKGGQDRLSEHGFSHAPAPRALGGVLVRGEIRRQATLSLVGIRALADAEGKTATDDARKVQRYLLGLALVALTYRAARHLRQGCLLVQDPDHKPDFRLVYGDGRRDAFALSDADALQYAKAAAESFVVGGIREATFDAKRANDALKGGAGRTRRTRNSQTAQRAANTGAGGQ